MPRETNLVPEVPSLEGWGQDRPLPPQVLPRLNPSNGRRLNICNPPPHLVTSVDQKGKHMAVLINVKEVSGRIQHPRQVKETLSTSK